MVEVADIDAVSSDLGLSKENLLDEPLAYLDRAGHYAAPWDVARRLAVRVAEVYSELVLEHVAKEQKDLQDKAVHGYTFRWTRSEPERYIPPEKCVERLREEEPVFEMIRQWCGVEAVAKFDEVTALRLEVSRIRALAEKASRQLRETGHPRLAKTLLDELDSPQPTD